MADWLETLRWITWSLLFSHCLCPDQVWAKFSLSWDDWEIHRPPHTNGIRFGSSVSMESKDLHLSRTELMIDPVILRFTSLPKKLVALDLIKHLFIFSFFIYFWFALFLFRSNLFSSWSCSFPVLFFSSFSNQLGYWVPADFLCNRPYTRTGLTSIAILVDYTLLIRAK